MGKPWPMVALREVLIEKKERIGTFNASGLPLLGVSNSKGLHRSGKTRIADMSKYLVVKQGYFAYNPMRINVGSIGWALSDNLEGIISPDYVVFTTQPSIDPNWVYLFLTSRTGLLAINFETAGSVRERLYFEFLSRIAIPLPPLSEQRRIVARIEELAAKIEEAKGLGEQISFEIPSILNSAIRDIFIHQGGHKNGTFSDFVVDLRYGTSVKCVDTSIGPPVLRMHNIQDGQIVYNPLVFIDNALVDKRMFLQEGDLLFNRTNSAELVGKCAVFKGSQPCLFASYLIRARLDKARANPSLVAYYINSSLGREYIQSQIKQQCGQANVNSKKLLAMPLSLPSVREQNRIAVYLEKVQAEADRFRMLQKKTQTELDALLPSVLDRAFKGEL